MRQIEGRLLLSATDLSNHLACDHLTQLNIRKAHGEPLPVTKTALGELLKALGSAHERGWLDSVVSDGMHVRRFDENVTRHAETLAELEQAALDTVNAMREGCDVIYQPFFFDGTWQGRADFLVRVDRHSALGAHSYEVYDAKLARHVRAEALLQLCEYSLQVERVQGVAPERMHVVLGAGTTSSHLVADFAAYHARIREQFGRAVETVQRTYPEKASHCSICDYAGMCDTQRREDDHLSLVARMRRDQARKLNAAGITRVIELAALPRDATVPNVVQASLDTLREQARLQVEARAHAPDAPPLYELLENDEPGFGLSALPEPSPGDVFFDMEGDGLHEQAIEYLFGAVVHGDDGPRYRRWLGHTPADERAAFESFIDWLMQRLQEHPSMHVYHYADYERSALQRLMGRHGTREAEVDRLLRGGVLVDLYRIVRQSVRLSTEGYGLKQVEQLYMPPRDGDVSDAQGSVVVYAEWLRTGDDELLRSIVRYNEVDCRSTLQLREWLEQRRHDVEVTAGGMLGRPAPKDASAPQKVAEWETAADHLHDRLTRDVPDERSARSEQQQATWLLAQLLAYHRRESKVGWWRWFRLIATPEDELMDDRDALGPLTLMAKVGEQGKSDVVRFVFAPQEHSIHVGDAAYTPTTRDGERDGVLAGRVVALDNVGGTIDLKRGTGIAERGDPTHLIPRYPFDSDRQARALLEIAEWVASNGIDCDGEHRAARDLLLRRRPRRSLPSVGSLRAASESAEDAAIRVVGELAGGCLAIQGPPGSGKTYTAARIAVHLARRGRRVAVTATAHKVIGRLLEEIARAADSAHQSMRIVQKCDQDERCSTPGVQWAAKNEEVIEAVATDSVDVAGGTAWLFTLDELAGSFDTLIVDEAGQMSLADVVAVSRCARNIVLVGDPRQLAQVVQGSHPDGAGVSALGHLLGNDVTVAADCGIFLDRTWRMTPAVCRYVSDTFYEGKLQPVDAAARQAIDVDGDAALSGLRTLAVNHDGDRTFSHTEAEHVRALVDELLGRTWRHIDGTVRTIGVADILVVAPYNAHVACLTQALPANVRVGTVDKFQGQEAAVSIFSMATSSTDDLPRNLEFLYSMNRLNVAVSRARCLSILVYSPALLHTRCHTPEQMRLVNALCRYADAALPWTSDTTRSDHSSQLSLLPAVVSA
ncbi:MAG: TM0106 family RecB-like putative nuclease [Candidatus Dormibacteria bacterium]